MEWEMKNNLSPGDCQIVQKMFLAAVQTLPKII